MDTAMIRWGILGTGAILPKIAGGFRLAHNVFLQAIASHRSDRAQAAASQWHIPRAYAGYDALLADAEIDAVFNALPNHLHCEWTIRALKAGRHVLCEKPLAPTVGEVERMFAAAHRCRRWLMEGFMYRFHPQIAEAKRRVSDIGQITHIRAQYHGSMPAADNPRLRPGSGGALLDLGCYCVNLIRLFAGEPTAVTATAHFHPVNDVDLTLTGQLEFVGASAEFTCSFERPGAYAVELTGTNGRLIIPHPWRPPAWPAEFTVGTETVRVNPPGVTADPLVPFALEIEHFSDCIRQGRPPQFPPSTDAEQDSRANARVLAQLTAAARSFVVRNRNG